MLLPSSLCATLVSPTTAPVPGRDLFGISVALADDLDHDGLREVWIGDATWSEAARSSQRPSSCVWAVSTRTGRALARIAAPTGALSFGWTLTGITDLDGDGMEDLAVGCDSYEEHPGVSAREGRVFLFSGASGVELCRIPGPRDELKRIWYSAHCGPSLAQVGDWNGDGSEDLAIGWSLSNAAGSESGRVEIVSPRDGGLLRVEHGVRSRDRLGYASCALPDLDGDGQRDLAASAVPDPLATRCGYVQLLGSRSSGIRTLAAPDDSNVFGGALALLDFERDFVHTRLVVGAPFDKGHSPALTIFALADGRELLRIERPSWAGVEGWAVPSSHDEDGGVRRSFGTCVLSVADRDGDGRADVLATMPQPSSVSAASIHSSANGEMLASVWTGEGGHEYSHVGIGAVALPDLDGDRVRDFALGGSSVRCGSCDGSVVLVSGRTLLPIRAIVRIGL